MTYIPEPLPISDVAVPDDIAYLTELLAKHTHDIWAMQRIKDGWSYGPQRDDSKKEHPCLVLYEDLPNSEKEYDRNAAIQTLKAIISLGYRIEKIDCTMTK